MKYHNQKFIGISHVNEKHKSKGENSGKHLSNTRQEK